ncbi:metal ABC transporter ATP-binding protein [Lachnoclostridium sp. Marseille-P6806]|uniref:metal ABC transporter ATP-binding protein n=1 Tax=Lachnoclostridium sp. Marseille-P6806 TaxID=2364793 RepID=UPI00103058DC|nr:metal ABC transporter ATP-binding protein [Lachnoclostridium sp. Marseille-P6806]
MNHNTEHNASRHAKHNISRSAKLSIREKDIRHSAGPVIHVEKLGVAYGDTLVFRGVTADVAPRTLTAVIGPNGAGKSTLIKAILRFIRPFEGQVTLFGEPLERVRRRIAYVPQTAAVRWNFPITAGEVVLMGRYARLGWFRRPGAADRERAEQALEEMEIADLRDRQIAQLSGGQKQRIFIARALCQDAELLIMDEPLAGVDHRSERIIMSRIRELQAEGRTILCVHHDLHTVPGYFDHVLLINRRIIAQGPTARCFTEENIALTYEEKGP